MEKLKVYIYSYEIPTIGFVDKEGAMHACAQAQKTAFQRLGQFSSMLGSRYTSDAEREVLMRVEDFCKNNCFEFEIVDLGTMSFLARLKLKMKGLKIPAVSSGDRMFFGIPKKGDLKKLMKNIR